MENNAENPYKAPEAEVVVNSGSNKLSSVYDRFSAWGVFGLSVITLGLYMYYWFINRTNKINAHVDNPISVTFMAFSIGFTITGSVIGYGAPFSGNTVLISISPLFSIVGAILQVVWYYKLRNRIHAYVNAQKGTYAWAGPVKTFFFNILYLQYKINKIIDNE